MQVAEGRTTSRERWLRQPQTFWFRKAVFQVHLWMGITLGVYILAISATGSVLVFRPELDAALKPKPVTVPVTGRRLSRDELRQAALRAYPGYEVFYVFEKKRPDPGEPTEIWLGRAGSSRKMRLFDPYTGRDLGDSVPWEYRFFLAATEFHGSLVGGPKGRTANGIGAIFLTVMGLTGLVLWWPGVTRWRRALTIDWKANWKRVNWDLHSAIGIWMAAFVLLWGITGSYLVFPVPFEKAVNRVFPLKQYRPIPEAALGGKAGVRLIRVADDDEPIPQRSRAPIQRSFGDWVLRWFSMLHFGNFGGLPVKVLWCALGMAPMALLATGALMWWNRALSREARSGWRRVAPR
jgi:uncharacterized iron-regulated membrane protein